VYIIFHVQIISAIISLTFIGCLYPQKYQKHLCTWNKNAFNILCHKTFLCVCLASVLICCQWCVFTSWGFSGVFTHERHLSFPVGLIVCGICNWWSKASQGSVRKKHERSVKWKSTGWFYEKSCQGNQISFIIMRNRLGIRTGNTTFRRHVILSFSSQIKWIKIAFFILKQINFLLNPQCSGSNCMLFQSVQDILKNIYQHYSYIICHVNLKKAFKHFCSITKTWCNDTLKRLKSITHPFKELNIFEVTWCCYI